MIDDSVFNEVAISPEVLAPVVKPEETDGLVEGKRMTYTTVMQLFPVHFGSACELRARALFDGQEIKGGRWKVRSVAGTDAPSATTKRFEGPVKVRKVGAPV
jgi:hypothetical protein